MEINGLKIRDIRDAQDVLMALETIKLSLENISDSMEDNYNNYNSVVASISKSVTKEKEIIQAINDLQIRSANLLKNINILNDNTEVISKNTISSLKSEFDRFERGIRTSASEALNSVDLSEFRTQIEKLFEEKISGLESEVNKLDRNNIKLETINDEISDTIKEQKEKFTENIESLYHEINSSIKKFNGLSKSLGWKSIAASMLGGAFIGAFVMMFFGPHISKQKFYSDQVQAKKKYEKSKPDMERRRRKLEGFVKFANDHNINFTYYVNKEMNMPFLMIYEDSIGPFMKTEDGDLLIGLK